jgi:hypothetical protein
MTNRPLRAWALAATLGCALLAGAAHAQKIDLRHMRGISATSNYGTNEAGFRRSSLAAAPAISADSVRVDLSRSSGSGGTWDLAAVSLSGVTLGGKRLASAGFWLSRNAETGQLGLAFNPSMDPSLAGVSGFAGDVNFARLPSGSTTVTDIARTSGDARNLVLAVIDSGAALAAAGNYQAAAGAGLTRGALLEALATMKASIQQADNPKAAYFEFLRSLKAEWIEFTVPIFTDSLADPSVKVRYRPAGDTSSTVYTFADADLQDFLVQAKAAGFKLVLGFEFYPVISDVPPASPGCGTTAYKPNRWLLGQPVIGTGEPDALCIKAADWWWNPAHPNHAANVATFFRTLTDVQVRYARMARETGVDMMLLGTEADNLFRTRSAAAPYNNNFRSQLTALVAAVRAEYKGLVAVEQLWTAIAHPDWYAGGAGTAAAFEGVAEDLGMDVIALSSYFPLAPANLSTVLGTAQFEAAWDTVFRQYLQPLKQKYPGKPIIFSEWGYTNDVNGPVVQASRLGEADAPGATAGGQQQANAIQAFFNVNTRYGNLVQGAFLYGVNFQDPQDCTHVTFGIYCKPGAQVLADAHDKWRRADADRVFAWAERVLPSALPAGTGTTGSAGGYYYRFYPGTGTYVGEKDGRLYLHNGKNWVLQDVGPTRTYLDLAASAGF